MSSVREVFRIQLLSNIPALSSNQDFYHLEDSASSSLFFGEIWGKGNHKLTNKPGFSCPPQVIRAQNADRACNFNQKQCHFKKVMQR